MRGITRISVLTFLVVVSVSLTLVLRDTMEAQRGRRILVFEASDAPAALKALLATRDFSSMDHLVIAGADKNGPVAKDIKAQSFCTKLVYNEKVLDELAGRRLEPRFSAVFAPASKPDKTPVNMFPIVNKQPLGGFKEPTPQTGGSIIKTPGSPGIMLVPGRDTKLLKEQQTGPPVPVTSGKINGEVVTTKFGPRDKYTIKLIPMPEKPDPTKKPLISTITKSFGEMDRFLDKIRLKQGRGKDGSEKSSGARSVTRQRTLHSMFSQGRVLTKEKLVWK